MEEPMYSIPVSKVIELVLLEERQNIRKYFVKILGEATAAQLDTYVPVESELLKIFKA